MNHIFCCCQLAWTFVRSAQEKLMESSDNKPEAISLDSIWNRKKKKKDKQIA